MLTRNLKEVKRAAEDLIVTIKGYETFSNDKLRELYITLTKDNIKSIRLELDIIEKEMEKE